MNADQMRNQWAQFKGDLKQQWGKFTDEDLLEIKGNYNTFVSKAQERYGEKKSELMKWANHWYQKTTPESEKPTAPKLP